MPGRSQPPSGRNLSGLHARRGWAQLGDLPPARRGRHADRHRPRFGGHRRRHGAHGFAGRAGALCAGSRQFSRRQGAARRAGRRRAGRRAGRPRRLVAPARRTRARLLLPRRRPARHADGRFTAAQRARDRQRMAGGRADKDPARLRRGEVGAPDRARDLRPARVGAHRAHEPAGRHRRCRHSEEVPREGRLAPGAQDVSGAAHRGQRRAQAA